MRFGLPAGLRCRSAETARLSRPPPVRRRIARASLQVHAGKLRASGKREAADLAAERPVLWPASAQDGWLVV